jgi:hypothetical protein
MSESIWKDDGHGITEAGDVGGDIQVGRAFSRRFVHSRLAGRHIEVRCYPIKGDGMTDHVPEDVIRLEVQTELMAATDPEDPGGTEVWSDLAYEDALPEAFDLDYLSVEKAEEAAQRYLKQLDPALHFTWDGKPEMGPASVLKYGEVLGKLAHEFSSELIDKHGGVLSYVQELVRKNNNHQPRPMIFLDYDFESVVDPQGTAWQVAWVFDTTNCIDQSDEGGWVVGVYWEPVTPRHTHYHQTTSPRQVPGKLSECDDTDAHDPRDSELWADYPYHPRLERPEVTGLPGHMERDLVAAYLANRQGGVEYAITDVTADADFTYRVRITNRTGHALNEAGSVWHTEEYGLYPDGFWRGIPINPHPGYPHEPPFCPNCGY